MKAKSIILTLACMAVLGAKADEGMWTLYNLPQAVYEQMKLEGYQLPYDQLYNADNAIMKAVVNFSGYCSGVVVSPDGLVFTNHHCGFESIRSHSTVEHDYMLNGFCAKSYEEELPNKNMFGHHRPAAKGLWHTAPRQARAVLGQHRECPVKADQGTGFHSPRGNPRFL